MKTINHIKRFARKNISDLACFGLLLTSAGIISSKILSPTITEVKLKDGKQATFIQTAFSPNVLYVNDADSFPRAFYTKIGIGLEYRDFKGITHKITDKGYSTFNRQTEEYENFVPFEKDSTLYWESKNYEDIMRQVNAERERQRKAEESR